MLAITLNNIFSLPFRCVWQTQELLHISLAVNYLFVHVNSLFNPALSQTEGHVFSDGAQNHWTWSPDN